jgi:ribosomal protein S18 acetylase RimI-like enzyme
MFIDSPRVARNGNSVVLGAHVRLSAPLLAPRRLWFRFPGRFGDLINPSIDPFVVALGPLASMLGEPIEVADPMSERLHAGLDEYWAVFHRWFPDRFARVTIRAPGYRAENIGQAASGSAFSGGVDSFFTLFRHMREHERHPTHALRYGLFVLGFDIPLAEQRSYDEAADAYEPALASCGVQLVRVATNLRQFVDHAGWELSHGSALCGTALTLAPAFRRFFVPSSKSYTTLEPWGSDPLVDGLLSTDQCQIVHDGAAYTRFDKLHVMKDWALVRPLLRTCYETVDSLRNCGRCANCGRTMMVLAALGVLDEFVTFPPLAPGQVASTSWMTPHERLSGLQSIAHARAHGRMEVARDGRRAMRASRIRLIRRAVWSRACPDGIARLLRTFRQHPRLRIHRSTGFLKVVDPAGGVPVAQHTGAVEVTVRRTADESAYAVTEEGMARWRAGAVRLELPSCNEAFLAQLWLLQGSLYPAALNRSLRLAPRAAQLFGILTDPRARRRGWARRILAHAEQEARNAGATACFALVERRDGRSNGLFLNMGYQPVVEALRVTSRCGTRFWCFGLAREAREYLEIPGGLIARWRPRRRRDEAV